jgi:hypothetical protein
MMPMRIARVVASFALAAFAGAACGGGAAVVNAPQGGNEARREGSVATAASASPAERSDAGEDVEVLQFKGAALGSIIFSTVEGFGITPDVEVAVRVDRKELARDRRCGGNEKNCERVIVSRILSCALRRADDTRLVDIVSPDDDDQAQPAFVARIASAWTHGGPCFRDDPRPSVEVVRVVITSLRLPDSIRAALASARARRQDAGQPWTARDVTRLEICVLPLRPQTLGVSHDGHEPTPNGHERAPSIDISTKASCLLALGCLWIAGGAVAAAAMVLIPAFHGIFGPVAHHPSPRLLVGVWLAGGVPALFCIIYALRNPKL